MSGPGRAPDDDTSALVSVVIPAFRAAHLIGESLESVSAQTWPAEHTEVIVVDGCSDDGTGDIARSILAGRGFVRTVVVENPGRTIPSNLNRGLAEAHGEFVCRIDVRSRLPANYISTCVDMLMTRPDLTVVGGRQLAIPPDRGDKGRGIARGLNNRYTMGMSRYRRGAVSGPSDTVYLGFYRANELRAVGGWDEQLLVNEDFDLSQRLGGHDTVWFDCSLEVDYVPRPEFRALFAQYHGFGVGKVFYWRLRGTSPAPRQWLALLALPGVTAAMGVAILLGARRHRRRTVVTALLGAAAAAVAAEYVGTSGPAGPGVRLASLVTTATTTIAWTVGAWTRLLGGRGRRH